MKEGYFMTKDTGRKEELLMQKMLEFPDGVITFFGVEPPYLEAKLGEKTIDLYPINDSGMVIFFTKLDGSNKEAQLKEGLMPYDLTSKCLKICYKGELYNIHLKSE